MKLTRATALACLLISTSFGAHAACASDDPVAIAQSFFAKHAEFTSQNPVKIKSIITARFFDALAREYKCAQGEVCAIETDPWTDAQDGKIGKPVEFALASKSDAEATVSMTFPFILDKNQHSQKHAKLILQRATPDGCWLIGDLFGPDGDSLVKDIEDWHKQYGDGD